MSIRAIAHELYKCQSKVHKLEDQLNQTDSYGDKEKLNEELRKARAELKILKNMLEGRKAQAEKPLKKFPYKF